MRIDRYGTDHDDVYCYPDSTVLRNRLGIQDASRLREAERNITALRILELRQHPPAGAINFQYLCRLHHAIFQDIYDWSGQVRTVNINKGNLFCLAQNIEPMATDLFNQLARERCLIGCPPEQMPLRLAYYLSEINVIHPFREGNGRTQRLFIELLAERRGYEVDFSEVSGREMVVASAESFACNYASMNALFTRITHKRK